MDQSKQSGITRPELEERLAVFKCAYGFEKLNREQLLPLARAVKPRLFSRNQYIFHEGDQAREAHVMARGSVRLCKLSSQGKVFTTTVAGRGDTLNAVVLFDQSPRFLSAQAMEDCQVLCLPGQVFVDFVAQHPQVALAIITILGKVTESIFNRTLDLVSERVEQRLVNLLLMLYYKFGNPIRTTNRELADLAGASTETIIRVMGQLSQDGMIKTRRGQIHIADPSYLHSLGRGPFWA